MNNPFKTYLFVPATRLDRASKALDGDADHVIIDLEDAVETWNKDVVRSSLKEFDKTISQPYWLRINAAHTADYAHDVAMIQTLDHVAGVLLPKAESALSITALHQATNLPIIGVIETAKGVLNIDSMATATGLMAMTYGCLDLAKSLAMTLGTPASKAVLDRIRTDLLLHSAVNELNAPIETIYADFNDDDGVGKFAKFAKDFGFGGQLVIHPKQIAPIRYATAHDDAMIDFAKVVLDHHEATGEAVFSVQGKMVDLPVIEWARGILER
ncbi:CoA ester lyase [Moraxella sp.]|uniref:HpcH/HpaI aldolase/citrate lyase family protein n=1 Tax=Moraxella sp. TaxID=479 RepID=UPI00260C0DD4|nr:CoA ester lyase [Moraxella sp.]MCP3896918.1 CoA ester lyase [Moraxella sp.]